MKGSKPARKSRKAGKKLAKPKKLKAAIPVPHRRPSVKQAPVVETPTATSTTKPTAAAMSARAKAARRTAAGKFTKSRLQPDRR